MNDTISLPGISGVLGICEIKLNRIDDGKKHINQSLMQGEKYDNPISIIVGNHGLGEWYLSQSQPQEAIHAFTQLLALSDATRQAHYSMLNKMGLMNAHLMNKEYVKAIRYGSQAEKETQNMQNENTLFSIYCHLGEAYSKLNLYDKSYYYINQALEIQTNSLNVKSRKVINDLLIKYDTEKKEKENIEKSLQVAQLETKIVRRNNGLLLSGIFALLIIGIFVLYRRNQRLKLLQLEQENERKVVEALMVGEEKERARVSRDFHDGVSSVSAGIRIQLGQAMEGVDKSKADEL